MARLGPRLPILESLICTGLGLGVAFFTPAAWPLWMKLVLAFALGVAVTLESGRRARRRRVAELTRIALEELRDRQRFSMWRNRPLYLNGVGARPVHDPERGLDMTGRSREV